MRDGITVRDAFWDACRARGLTTFFANPGSTEVPLLADFPADFDFVLALHESSVVGMATGRALATGRPALALLHTTAGLANAVGGIATARENRVPLVLVVGQQDRRHLVNEPFLTGRLEQLAGDYPVWVGTPSRADDVPELLARAANEATLRRGPAILIVPMDDWLAPVQDPRRPTSPLEVVTAGLPSPEQAGRIAALIASAAHPAIVAGAAAATERSWAALERIAAKSSAPVWQESFGARPGYRQTAANFRGLLPAGRAELRRQLDGHDLVVVAGAQALRQYGYEPGPLFPEGTRVVVVTDDIAKAVVSTADLALVGDVDGALEAIDAALPGAVAEIGDAPRPELASAGVLTPAAVFHALAARLEPDAAIFEETPSTRDDLVRHNPARSPFGFVSAAMGGLGFAMPAAVGFRMASPGRTTVAVVGDGSSMYSIQSLWSAQRYGAGVVFVILKNDAYAIMDRLAAAAGGTSPWPGFADLAPTDLASGFAVESRTVATVAELDAVLDEIAPSLPHRRTPLVLVADVSRVEPPVRS